jgi:hypothetical protein
MKIVTIYNNFARGKIDHDMIGRNNLQIYETGYDIFKNFISNFKGNAIFRAGLTNILAFEDCGLVEFAYSNNQNYILVLYNTKMRFLSYDGSGNFGWVLSGGSPLEVTTPYTLAQSKEIAFRQAYTQNFDTMIICHPSHEPYKLIRTGAAAFTFRTYSRKDDPFPTTWAATKNITAVTQATTAQITVVAHGYSVGDRVKIAGITGMTELNNWTANILTTPTANTFTIDVDTTSFTAYAANGTTAKVTAGGYPKAPMFYKGRLYYANTSNEPTTIWGSEAGEYFIHTVSAPVVADSALKLIPIEISQGVEWLFPGDNSLIAGSGGGILAINGGGVGNPITADTVDATLTSGDPASEAAPLRKDGLIFYVSTNKRTLNYFRYDILTETFIAQDATVIAYDVSKPLFKKMRYVKDRNNLIYVLRDDNTLTTLNFNEQEKIIGWHEHVTEGSVKDIAAITDNDGNLKLFALVLRNSVYYIEQQSDYPEFVNRNDFITTEKSVDDNAYARYVAEQLKTVNYLDNSSALSNLQTTSITYDSGAGTITAAGAVFSSGDVGKHIVYKTSTGYESGRFEITGYTSTTVVSVSVLQTPTANTYASWYLTFQTITGLSRFNGLTVSVVADGGYLDDYEVSSGTIALSKQVSHVNVGYKYTGRIKSFPLGFQLQAENTQGTMKAICRVGVRAIASASGKFGPDPYRLESIQQLSQADLNYLPPLPIDGTKYIDISDDNELDKSFYFVQDEPVPFQLALILIDVNHSYTREQKQ